MIYSPRSCLNAVVAFMFMLTAGLPARAQRARPLMRLMEKKLDKDAAENRGPAPDYANPYFWAAFPGKPGPADSVPEGLKEEKRDTLADVFYIHPTTYVGADDEDPVSVYEHPAKAFASMQRAAWNADLDDTALNRSTDLRPVLYQATAFNGVSHFCAEVPASESESLFNRPFGASAAVARSGVYRCQGGLSILPGP
ncbi:MAG: hypothetical protein Q8927_13545 [Bacteroidota bacterium]|nr:hypothetical protein [Bacteroidota bacterium]MDP4217221.1 hypothetical protein [Bacteroidota bacterium]MDP4247066.1 hypothetical protein [Bacteroidota bacterium]MDP4257360.1 hypothetical protein [Bacteroidota bacterium]